MISIARPLLGNEEEAAASYVLASGQLVQGEQVALFEQRFAECVAYQKQSRSLLERRHCI